MVQGTRYQIRVEGQLDPHWTDWFSGFELRHEPGGTTMMTGTVVDGSALFGLIDRVRDAGLTLVSVNRVGTEREVSK